mmetsp:Transcript_66502/g.144968  ORF Transcript_66502/g.144968 Transcript_66502/m.144968 type:complete len:229 (-) Transcript_66502:142-828(-)
MASLGEGSLCWRNARSSVAKSRSTAEAGDSLPFCFLPGSSQTHSCMDSSPDHLARRAKIFPSKRSSLRVETRTSLSISPDGVSVKKDVSLSISARSSCSLSPMACVGKVRRERSLAARISTAMWLAKHCIWELMRCATSAESPPGTSMSLGIAALVSGSTLSKLIVKALAYSRVKAKKKRFRLAISPSLSACTSKSSATPRHSAVPTQIQRVHRAASQSQSDGPRAFV